MRNMLCAMKKLSMILLSIITLFFILRMEALHVHAYDELTTKVDELFKEWDRNDSPGAALGIIRDGRIIYKRGYGMANLEHNIPIKPDSVFRIASISKQFFGAGIIILEQQGKISLDDNIRKYLPELHDYGNTVTIRHLIHHTGGIRDYLSLHYLAGRRIGKRENDYFSMKDHMELMARQKGLNLIPGEKFLYSNSGYILLAEIIARVSGSSEADFWCLLKQLLLLNRRPRKLLSTDPNSQKHGKPPKKDCHCRENFPKAELFFNQPGLHRRCPYFIPEF